MIKDKIKNLIEKVILEAQKREELPSFKIPEISIEHPKDSRHGDYASNINMQLGSICKRTPMDIGKILVDKPAVFKKAQDLFEKIEIVKPGFINFTLSKKWLQKQVGGVIKKGLDFGKVNIGKGKTVIIDYSAPNIAKPMSIGHLRSTIIGQAIYNIYEFLGYRCIGDNHLGDWGTQFGKLIYAYKEWGDREKIKQNPIRELLKLYVKFHNEVEKNPDLENEGRRWFKKLEDKNKEAVRLWRWFTKLSLREFNRIYELLDIKFDYELGESFYNNMLDNVIKEAQDKGITKESKGAIIIPLEEHNLPPLLIQKSDGATLYATRDLATAKYRIEKFKPVKIIYVVGAEQKLYFRQLFKTFELINHAKGRDFVHVCFGLIRLAGVRMATRRGKVIFLEDVLEKAIDLARKIVDDKNPNLSEEIKDKIARQIGIGAVKYNDLSQNRITDITFDWNKMLSLKGDSAPYLQYTHARICSILKKGKVRFNNKFDSALLRDKREIALLRKLYIFPEIITEAAEEYMPNYITTYLFELAQNFNLFYNEIRVLQAEKNVSLARLHLAGAVGLILKNGLALLCIEAPEQM